MDAVDFVRFRVDCVGREWGADVIVEEQRLGGMMGDDGRCCTALVTLLQVIVT